MKNIYVGNLPMDLTEDELRELFVEFGDIESSSIIKDKFTGQSRGFGFVKMSNDEEAEAAISGVDGKNVKGNTLRVNEARPRPEGGRGGFGGGGGGPRRGGEGGGFGGPRRGGSGFGGNGGGRGRF